MFLLHLQTLRTTCPHMLDNLQARLARSSKIREPLGHGTGVLCLYEYLNQLLPTTSQITSYVNSAQFGTYNGDKSKSLI